MGREGARSRLGKAQCCFAIVWGGDADSCTHGAQSICGRGRWNLAWLGLTRKKAQDTDVTFGEMRPAGGVVGTFQLGLGDSHR